MKTQKIIVLTIDVQDGELAMKQVQKAAGEGTWRIISMLDLEDTRGFRQWYSDRNHGRRVLVVVEENASPEHRTRSADPALLHAQPLS